MHVTTVPTTIGDVSYLRNEWKNQGIRSFELMKLFIIMGRFDIYKISWPFYDIRRRNQKDLPFS